MSTAGESFSGRRLMHTNIDLKVTKTAEDSLSTYTQEKKKTIHTKDKYQSFRLKIHILFYGGILVFLAISTFAFRTQYHSSPITNSLNPSFNHQPYPILESETGSSLSNISDTSLIFSTISASAPPKPWHFKGYTAYNTRKRTCGGQMINFGGLETTSCRSMGLNVRAIDAEVNGNEWKICFYSTPGCSANSFVYQVNGRNVWGVGPFLSPAIRGMVAIQARENCRS